MPSLRDTTRSFDKGTDIRHHVGDLSDTTQAGELIRLADELGGADICVPAAGVAGPRREASDASDGNAHGLGDVDFTATVAMPHGLVPSMLRPTPGHVVVLTSEQPTRPVEDMMPESTAGAVGTITTQLQQRRTPTT